MQALYLTSRLAGAALSPQFFLFPRSGIMNGKTTEYVLSLSSSAKLYRGAAGVASTPGVQEADGHIEGLTDRYADELG